VLIPQATGKYLRVDYQLRDGESEQEAIAEKHPRPRQCYPEGYGHATWELDVERLLREHAVPRRLRHGRVFFIGDAGRIRAIFGVRRPQ